jgi:hypothetical protein
MTIDHFYQIYSRHRIKRCLLGTIVHFTQIMLYKEGQLNIVIQG